MLDDTLKRIADPDLGFRGLYLIGLDGMPVAGSGPLDGLSVEDLVASYADLLRKVADCHRDVELGEPSEVVVSADGARVVLRTLTDEYGLMAVLDGEAILGRARHEMTRAARELAPELV